MPAAVPTQTLLPGETVVETPRLRVRAFTRDDALFILRLVNEPSWLRFIGDRGVRSLPDAIRYLEDGPLASYARSGFGLSCVVDRETGAPIGMCGLLRRAGLPAPDIGFAFLPEAWGKGHATESAAAVLHHARDVLGFPRVVAIVDADNLASIRVLERLGMERGDPCRPPGIDHDVLLYSLALDGGRPPR